MYYKTFKCNVRFQVNILKYGMFSNNEKPKKIKHKSSKVLIFTIDHFWYSDRKLYSLIFVFLITIIKMNTEVNRFP